MTYLDITVVPQEFYQYLRDKGFTDNGANESINRIKNNRADREDVYHLSSFRGGVFDY